ncbi:MAG: PDZ domain-containing protein, partial [Deltaproteobacteria bacterium]|nr:PDZ domain-containing protein [Deltaproteobacteria bacterium]
PAAGPNPGTPGAVAEVRVNSAGPNPGVGVAPEKAGPPDAQLRPDARVRTGPVTATVVGGSLELRRGDVDSALRDFNSLAASIGGAFTPTGLRIDAIAPGSLFARVGLRAGDVIIAIDGKLMRSLDDAAELYARAPSLQAVTVQMVRAGKPGTLQIAIR